MFLSVTIALAIIAIVSLFFYGRQRHQYWAERGVWTPKGYPILGHVVDLMMKKYRWEYIDKIYCANKDKSYWGMYTIFSPSLTVTDPELIKLILVKDANSFIDRPIFNFSENENIFREFLTLITGEKWKALRSIISPTFTSGKIKGTFPLIEESVETLLKNCKQKMTEDGFVDMKTMLGYYSMDVITTCAFGIKVDCFSEKSEFVTACFDAMNPTAFDAFKMILFITNAKLFYALGFSLTKKGLFYLEKCILETVNAREIANIKRGDFLDLMIEALKNHKNSTVPKELEYPMSMNTIVSSSILFILAGYDTTSAAMSFIFYLLANNPECQNELRKELQKIRDTEGKINYQNLMEAKYLDACVFESLRMYGPAYFLERACTKDYKIPSHDLIIPKDMTISIPTWSLQYDPRYWDEPKTFKPERFLPENKQNINQYAFLGFGQGPRNCIGMRFALLEMKLAVAEMVLNFNLSLKPGFELGLTKMFTVLKSDSNGIPIVFRPLESDQ